MRVYTQADIVPTFACPQVCVYMYAETLGMAGGQVNLSASGWITGRGRAEVLWGVGVVHGEVLGKEW